MLVFQNVNELPNLILMKLVCDGDDRSFFCVPQIAFLHAPHVHVKYGHIPNFF